MPARPFVLASASPARLRLLRAAGLDPVVVVSGVDEDDVPAADTRSTVATLARRKADAVAQRVDTGALVLGCDSMLQFDGHTLGKPRDGAEAIARWREMRAHTGVLLTGHCLVDTVTGARAAAVAATDVHFGNPSDVELDAYVATGEPLAVAGGFTIDGYASAFVEGVTGDPGNVIGCSVPLVRQLLRELDVEITDLWR